MDEETTSTDVSEQRATPTSVGWRTGRIGLPALIAVLIVLGAAGLGAASIGGWGSVAVLVILIVACLALITSWAVTD